jgi:monoamine oxidase
MRESRYEANHRLWYAARTAGADVSAALCAPQVLVIEGRQRLGGRVHTLFSETGALEVGCTFLAPAQPPCNASGHQQPTLDDEQVDEMVREIGSKGMELVVTLDDGDVVSDPEACDAVAVAPDVVATSRERFGAALRDAAVASRAAAAGTSVAEVLEAALAEQVRHDLPKRLHRRAARWHLAAIEDLYAADCSKLSASVTPALLTSYPSPSMPLRCCCCCCCISDSK